MWVDGLHFPQANILLVCDHCKKIASDCDKQATRRGEGSRCESLLCGARQRLLVTAGNSKDKTMTRIAQMTGQPKGAGEFAAQCSESRRSVSQSDLCVRACAARMLTLGRFTCLFPACSCRAVGGRCPVCTSMCVLSVRYASVNARFEQLDQSPSPVSLPSPTSLSQPTAKIRSFQIERPTRISSCV